MKEELQKKIDLKTKPIGSLGKLEEIALKIGQIQNSLTPTLTKPTMLVFAGDHGLTEEGISPFPKEVTFQMVMNFIHGGAAINVFCRQNGIDLKVIDAGVDYEFDPKLPLIHAKVANGTNNILKEPAMSVELCQKAITKGRELAYDEFEEGSTIIGFGEMGIGNTSSAALLIHKFTGNEIEMCVGRGTGLDDAGVQYKKEILKKASAKYNISSPLEILATFGGYEIAMMCGAMLGAKEKNMILMIDGFIATSALIAAYNLNNNILENCIFCHLSDENAHKLALDYLKVTPILDLGMRLGEGTGAAVAFPIIKSAVTFLNEMASFDDAGVSNI